MSKMRSWITLFEGNDLNLNHLAREVADSEVRQVYREISQFVHEPLDRADDSLLAEVVSRLETVFANGPAKIWRYVVLPKPYTSHLLKRANAIGVCWTFRPYDLNLDALSVYEDEGDLLLLETTVTSKQVDWKQTLTMNIELPWESEITLKKGTRIRISRVFSLPEFDVDSRRIDLQLSFGARA